MKYIALTIFTVFQLWNTAYAAEKSNLSIQDLKNTPVSLYDYGLRRLSDDLKTFNHLAYPTGYVSSGVEGRRIAFGFDDDGSFFQVTPPPLWFDSKSSVVSIQDYCEETRDRIYRHFGSDWKTVDGLELIKFEFGSYWASSNHSRKDVEQIGKEILKNARVEVFIFKNDFDKCVLPLETLTKTK